jgi:serine/threonine protein kinase
MSSPASSRDKASTFSIDDYLASLKQIYDSNANLRDYWSSEEPVLRDIVPLIVQKLSFNYILVKPINVGGSGIVSLVQDINLDTKRALKISRPSPGKEVLLARVLISETEALLRLSHQNIIRVFAQGAVSTEDKDFPFYVMEYIEGVQDSDDFLAQPHVTDEDVLKVFSGTVSAVEYMHSQGKVHMDLKPDNLLVTPTGTPILSDLGFAKDLKADSGYTFIGGTEGYIHPDARRLVEEAVTDPNRLRGEAHRDLLNPVWDLYSLGKTFLRLLQVLDEKNPKALQPYTKRYLRLLACRLLDGKNGEHERALGISARTFEQIKYRSATQVAIDLSKLMGTYNLNARIPELNIYTQDTIQASGLAATPFTNRVKALVSDPAVLRLGSFTQLGLLNLVYPTAIHTRLEHTLGTFTVTCRYIEALYYDELNPPFRQIMSEEDLSAALVAALVHDLGQFPLAHDVEEADPYTGVHESLGWEILENKDASIRSVIEKEWNVSVERVLAILKSRARELTQHSLKDRILHSLIDGPIDADKVDYLVRDSINLGLGYGRAIDFERLLRCLTVVFREENRQTYAVLGIHEKGKIPSEAVLFARYAMYGQVYWHHTYRSVKAMLHRMVWDMLFNAGTDEQRTRLRTEFRQFVSPVHPGSLNQQSLFEPTLDLATSPIRGINQIQQADLSVLKWISERSPECGDEMLQLFGSRRLFKRVMVLSREKAQDKDLVEDLVEFQRKTRRSWGKRLQLQQLVQKLVVELVENPPVQPPESAIITPGSRNSFIVDGRAKPTVLLDIPIEKFGADTPLEYLVEEDRRRSKTDELQTGSLAESNMWKALQASSYESIGKVRVFCHPSHSDFLSAFLQREYLEGALREALRGVEAD